MKLPKLPERGYELAVRLVAALERIADAAEEIATCTESIMVDVEHMTGHACLAAGHETVFRHPDPVSDPS